jgi:hypothetical protein
MIAVRDFEQPPHTFGGINGFICNLKMIHLNIAETRKVQETQVGAIRAACDNHLDTPIQEMW